MTQSIITYYIPQNLHINKGKIYTLYINKVKNLDLLSIIPKKTPNTMKLISQPQLTKSNSISLSEEDYKEIISLADTSIKLYNQSQNIIKKLTKERNK